MAPKTATLLTVIDHPEFKPSDKSLSPAKLTPKLAAILAQITELPQDEIETSQVETMARRLYTIVKKGGKKSWPLFKEKNRQELESSSYTSQVF